MFSIKTIFLSKNNIQNLCSSLKLGSQRSFYPHSAMSLENIWYLSGHQRFQITMTSFDWNRWFEDHITTENKEMHVHCLRKVDSAQYLVPMCVSYVNYQASNSNKLDVFNVYSLVCMTVSTSLITLGLNNKIVYHS